MQFLMLFFQKEGNYHFVFVVLARILFPLVVARKWGKYVEMCRKSRWNSPDHCYIVCRVCRRTARNTPRRRTGREHLGRLKVRGRG